MSNRTFGLLLLLVTFLAGMAAMLPVKSAQIQRLEIMVTQAALPTPEPNVVGVTNPPIYRRVQDLRVGEIAYVMESAFDSTHSYLDQSYPVYNEPHLSVTLQVKCVEPGKYVVVYGRMERDRWIPYPRISRELR